MTFFATLRRFTKGKRSTRGATAVEFALVAPVFLLFVLGIIDFGRLFWVKNMMQYATEQTARYAMVTPSASLSALEAYADDQASGMVDGITFVAATETIDDIDYRTITASYSFEFMMPLIGSTLALSAKSRTPVNEL